MAENGGCRCPKKLPPARVRNGLKFEIMTTRRKKTFISYKNKNSPKGFLYNCNQQKESLTSNRNVRGILRYLPRKMMTAISISKLPAMTRIIVIWVLLVLALMQVATSPLTANQQQVVEYNNNTLNPPIIPTVNRRSTSLNLDNNSTTMSMPTPMEWLLTNTMGNWFHNVILWFSEMLQLWKLYWWPPIITTVPTTITVSPLLGNTNHLREKGSKESINITESLPSSSSSSSSSSSLSTVRTQTVVHSISLQVAGGPTSQPSRQPTRQPTRRPSRLPSSQPSRQPTSRPSRPSGQPSRQPTRYDCILFLSPNELFLLNHDIFHYHGPSISQIP